MLFANRVSCRTMRANQVRLCLATVAYVLLRALRQYGLAQTELAQTQCETIRVKLLKISAVIRVSVRRVVVSLSEAYPLREVFVRVWEKLSALTVPRRPAVVGSSCQRAAGRKMGLGTFAGRSGGARGQDRPWAAPGLESSRDGPIPRDRQEHPRGASVTEGQTPFPSPPDPHHTRLDSSGEK